MVGSKLKNILTGVALTGATLAPAAAEGQTPQDVLDNKYKDTVTLQNDTVNFVNGTHGYYDETSNGIYLKKGRLKASDFGFKNAGDEKDFTDLVIVHERQHQITHNIKKVGKEPMSLHENYQRLVHDEIVSLIAEKLEIRRQYKEAETLDEKKAVLERFSHNPDNRDYVAAIASGRVNPDSEKSEDFAKEMGFIKDSSTRYRADPTDDGYRGQWESLSMAYLNRVGNNAQSNPEALKKDIALMYNIGGIDFSQYGEPTKTTVLENQ